jgi:hypothetical protein
MRAYGVPGRFVVPGGYGGALADALVDHAGQTEVPPGRPTRSAAGRIIAGCFTGRAPQLRQLFAWMDGDGGVTVVTGSPGAGKSALLGLLVCAAHPGLRGVPSLTRSPRRSSTTRDPPTTATWKVASCGGASSASHPSIPTRSASTVLTSSTSPTTLHGWARPCPDASRRPRSRSRRPSDVSMAAGGANRAGLRPRCRYPAQPAATVVAAVAGERAAPSVEQVAEELDALRFYLRTVTSTCWAIWRTRLPSNRCAL